MYTMYIENRRVIGPSGQTLFATESYKCKSEHIGDQLFHVNMSIVAINHAEKGFAFKDKMINGESQNCSKTC